MMSLFSTLKCSGRHWSRAALAWVAFAVIVHGLAQFGAEGADAERSVTDGGSSLGALGLGAESSPLPGRLQVADVSMVAFEPGRFDADQFGDADDLSPAH